MYVSSQTHHQLPTSPSGHGTVRLYSSVQVTFCPLASLGITAGRCPFVQAFGKVIIPSLLSNGALEVTMTLARKAFVCSGDCCSELALWRRLVETFCPSKSPQMNCASWMDQKEGWGPLWATCGTPTLVGYNPLRAPACNAPETSCRPAELRHKNQ
ncbi:hypothetical protein Acr_29g0004840 [Actinidia rufa]|uniref:Uncharacterized protein n=1 Tax=Actinidia rufa TaxID=165716 RepID=A0A7J0HE80_9ERIC|nr:hypothetical protein Acr_29g0004840 [Actinidia rufa]